MKPTPTLAEAVAALRRIRSVLLARPDPPLTVAGHLTRAIAGLEHASLDQAAAHIDAAVGGLPQADPVLVQLAALAVLCTMSEL